MENKKIIFETAEQIKEHFISLIKNGKKVKDDEIIKACQDIDMSDEDMADLIDEILSIDEDNLEARFYKSKISFYEEKYVETIGLCNEYLELGENDKINPKFLYHLLMTKQYLLQSKVLWLPR